uniref:cAMP receptor cAR n=1 Tax=Cavenderia aureostipes TaxID=142829 RepID=B3VSF1_9MYCE|nr:cAMP receptor cAR [Cavenderia aureostipes]
MDQDLDQGLITAQYVVLLFADFTSIIGCFCVLVGFWRLKLLRNHITRIISCFCLTSFFKDLISCILTLTQSHRENDFSCYLFAIAINYGSLSCWLWTLCLAVSIYLLIVKRIQEAERLEKYYYLICWGLPLISTIIMLAKGLVERVVGWCWIGGQYTAYRFGIFYVPFFIIFATSAVLVGLTCQYTYNVIHNGVSDNKDRHITYQFKLVNYIIVFLVCWIFAVVNRIINSLNIFDYTCNMLHTYLSISHGFYASLVFIYNNPLMWRYFGAKILSLFTPFGFCLDRAKRLERNKNNNNPSPYSSSRGVFTSGQKSGAGASSASARGTSTGAGIDFDTEEPIEMIQVTGADVIPSTNSLNNSPMISSNTTTNPPSQQQQQHHHNNNGQVVQGQIDIIGDENDNNNNYEYGQTNNNNNNHYTYDYQDYSPPPPKFNLEENV